MIREVHGTKKNEITRRLIQIEGAKNRYCVLYTGHGGEHLYKSDQNMPLHQCNRLGKESTK
jgi:hypothetical protein